MGEFSWRDLLIGAFLGGAVTVVGLASMSDGLNESRVKSGVFTYDGKAFLLLPIRNPAAAVPPG